MKTTLLLLPVFLLTTLAVHAQIDKGRVQIGGSFGLGYQKLGTYASKNTSINFSPSIGTFYKTNQLVGAFLNYTYNQYSNSSNSNSIKEITRNYGIGIFFRQYKAIAQRLYLFFDERGEFSYQNETIGSASLKLYTSDVSVQPGLAYNITRNLQLETTINNLLNVYYSGGQGTTTVGLSSSLEGNLASNIRVGFRFYLK